MYHADLTRERDGANIRERLPIGLTKALEYSRDIAWCPVFPFVQDHLEYFYKMKPEAVPMKLTGMDKVINNYNELRDQLGCKDLKWYLENVDHEMDWEKDVICHPHARPGDPIKCKGSLIPGRWTVTETIPVEEYIRRKEAVEAQRNENVERTDL